MTTYAFPTITPNSSSFELVSNTRIFQSPLTNAIQTTTRKGSLWRISMQFNNLSGSDRATLQAFLSKLNGAEHRFTVHDHSFTRRGAGGGTPLVNGASQTGTSLVLDGASSSVNNWLMTGDYISFNNELHMVTADTNSDGSGNVTLPIAPPIRKSPADDLAVDIAAPIDGVFILTSSASWDTRPGLFSNFTVEGIEDVLA